MPPTRLPGATTVGGPQLVGELLRVGDLRLSAFGEKACRGHVELGERGQRSAEGLRVHDVVARTVATQQPRLLKLGEVLRQPTGLTPRESERPEELAVLRSGRAAKLTHDAEPKRVTESP
jgi:hypothetical protein